MSSNKMSVDSISRVARSLNVRSNSLFALARGSFGGRRRYSYSDVTLSESLREKIKSVANAEAELASTLRNLISDLEIDVDV